MSLISLELARQHLRIDAAPDDDPESLVLPIYIGAAVGAAIDFINRQVYETEAELQAAVLAGTAGVAPLVVTDTIRAAMLLTLGHFYVNREDTVVGISVVELPNGARFLLRPHRIGMGV
jgi:hypothetical protein